MIRRAIETPIMFEIRAALASLAQTHRNNTGFDVDRKVHYGLGRGGPDLVSIPCGRFAGFEVKAPNGRLDADQQLWHAAARNAGAFVTTVRDPGAALEALTRARLCRCRSCGCVSVPTWEHFE